MEKTGGVIPKKDTVTSLAATELRRPTALQECFMAFAPLRESEARPFMSEGGEGLNLKWWVELVLLCFVGLLPQGVGSSKIFRAPLYFVSLAQEVLS